jgi:NAD-dependent dihydropyrimidine dehydrogenase PreA subunit
VCPRNAIEVTSITHADQIVSIKICPQNLFYKDDVAGVSGNEPGIRYKYSEISKCQGCLKCELSCPDGAIEPIKYEV